MSSSPPWRCTTCLTIARPEPGAAGLARAAAVDAIEALGQARQMLARDAEAGVAHRELAARRRRRSCQRDVDAAAVGRVAHGVADEVADRALQLGSRRRRSARRRRRRRRCACRPADSARASASTCAQQGVDADPAVGRAGAGCPRAAPASAGRSTRSACARSAASSACSTRLRSASVSGRLRSVSRKPDSTVSGVRISCETLATKSRRIASARSRSVMSCDSTQLQAVAVAPDQHRQRARGRAADRNVTGSSNWPACR